jgi:hypothetical protein
MGNPHRDTKLQNKFDKLLKDVHRLERREKDLKRLVLTILLPQNREYMPDMLVEKAKKIAEKAGYDFTTEE